MAAAAIPICCDLLRVDRAFADEAPAAGEKVSADSVGQVSGMADAVEAIGQDVKEKAANELVGFEGHDLGLAGAAIVLPGEADPAVIEGHDAAVGDGDAVGVARQIGEHLFWPPERRLGVDDPIGAPQIGEALGEGLRRGETSEIAEELQISGLEGGAQFGEEHAAEETCQGTDGQEEPRLAGHPALSIERGSAARYDAMDVGMMLECLPPGMEDGEGSASRWRGLAASFINAAAAERNRM